MQLSRKIKAFGAGANLSSAVAIAFSLTFVGAGLALLAGLFPDRLLSVAANVDTGVVLLFVPLCALVFAIILEVVRSTLRGPIRIHEPRPTASLTGWRPGHGEG